MNKQTNRLIKESENLLNLSTSLIDYGKQNPGNMKPDKIQEFTFWITRIGQFIDKSYPKDSQYHDTYNNFRKRVPVDRLHSNSFQHLYEITGILNAIKYELENGLSDSLEALIQADIFADFLEMGEYLLKEEYKDASAVIIGSVLEDTLRKLAIKNSIAITNDKGKKLTIEPLNVELAKKEVYNQLIKKQITSWADLRNNAAHGHYEEYDKKQVGDMLLFVQSFSSEYLN